MKLSLPAALLCLAVLAKSADAQVCIGLPDNTRSPVNLSAAFAFPEGGTVGGGRLGVGGSLALAGASVGFVSSNALDRTAPAFAADGGLSIPIGSGSARLCPVISGTFRYGPEIEDVLLTGVSGSLGLHIGGTVTVSQTFAVMPFAGGSMGYIREEAKRGTAVAVASDGGGTITGGLGLQFGGVFTVAPVIDVPIGFDGDTRPTFSIQASIGFGTSLRK